MTPITEEASKLRDDCMSAAKDAFSEFTLESAIDFYEAVAAIFNIDSEELDFIVNIRTEGIFSNLVQIAVASALQHYQITSNTVLADRIFEASIKAAFYPGDSNIVGAWDNLYPALNNANKFDRLLILKQSLDQNDCFEDYPILRRLGYNGIKEFLDSPNEDVYQRISLYAQAASIDGGGGVIHSFPIPP
jgi:hypothetical protein